MDWEEIKKLGSLSVNNQVFSLAHLQDRKYHFTIEASNNHPSCSFELLVQYSSHCISYGPKSGQANRFTPADIENAIVDHRGIPRCFCETRYRHSLRLMDVFSNFLDRHCYFTGHENWMTFDLFDEQGKRVEYEIYFRLYRESGRFLRLYVESAYVRQDSNLPQRLMNMGRRDKVKAKTLLSNKLKGKLLRRP